MARKLLFSLFITSALLVLNYSPASAKSGCCSSHGGVSCAAGPQANGRVICNDGWTGSSCYYSEMIMCGGYSTPTSPPVITTPIPTVRPATPTPTPRPTQTLRPTLASTQTPRPTLTPTPKPTETSSPSQEPTVEGTSTEAPSPAVQPTEVPTPTTTPLVAGNTVSDLVLPIAYIGIPIFIIYKMMKKKEQTPPSV